MVPLLTAKRDLEKFVDSAEVRIKLLNEKLSEVEMQQVNAEVHHKKFRLSTHLKIPTNISNKCKS